MPDQSSISSTKGRKTLECIVRLLVQGDYEALERLSGNVRLPADQIRFGVERFGRTLQFPPDDLWKYVTVHEVTGSQPRRWMVDVDLYTKEEGRSDLTLQLTLIDDPAEVFRVEINDLRVL